MTEGAEYLQNETRLENRVAMVLNRVKTVAPMSDYRLDIVFRDGKHGVFACRPYRNYPCFKRIWDVDVFAKVMADHGTVMWPDGSDLCPDEVYDKIIDEKEVRT